MHLFSSYAQNFDAYKYVYVEELKYNGGENDIWGISAMVTKAFIDKGFQPIQYRNINFMSNAEKTLVLLVSISHSNVVFGYNYVTITIKDIYGKHIKTLEGRGMGMSVSADFKKATKKALKEFNKMTYHFDFSKNENYIKAQNTTITTLTNLPKTTPQQITSIGFALENGYIVTNQHIEDNIKHISINGINGDFTKSYNAQIVKIDKTCDWVLLKIEEDTLLFDKIPYTIKSTMANIGEEVYALSHSLTQKKEADFFKGIVNARSDSNGDVTYYQISMPIQPEKRGVPVFDMKGNIIGITCAKHTETGNTIYVLKASYLKNFIENSIGTLILSENKSISKLQIKDQIKTFENFIYIINCIK